MRDRLIELLNAISCKTGCVCSALDEGRCSHLDSLDRCQIEAIADYLLSNGVIVPPCKMGDTVYVLTSDSITGFEKSRVKRMLLKNLQDGTTIKIIIPCVCDDWGGAVREFYPEDFGKTVFFTEEEAEQALKEREQQ